MIVVCLMILNVKQFFSNDFFLKTKIFNIMVNVFHISKLCAKGGE